MKNTENVEKMKNAINMINTLKVTTYVADIYCVQNNLD